MCISMDCRSQGFRSDCLLAPAFHIIRGSDPVLSPDSRHAAELAHIVGDDDQTFAAGMTANLYVVGAARRSRPIQLRPNLTVMRRCFGLERQHVEARHEMLD